MSGTEVAVAHLLHAAKRPVETTGKAISYKNREIAAMDRRLTVTAEDIDWLRKLRNARAANQPSPDIPTSVVRKLTMLAYAEVKGPREHSIKARDALFDKERRKQNA